MTDNEKVEILEFPGPCGCREMHINGIRQPQMDIQCSDHCHLPIEIISREEAQRRYYGKEKKDL